MDESAENLPIPQVSKDIVPKVVPPKRTSDITLKHEQSLDEIDGARQVAIQNYIQQRMLLHRPSKKSP